MASSWQQWWLFEKSFYYIADSKVLQIGPYSKRLNICLSIIDNMFIKFCLIYYFDII